MSPPEIGSQQPEAGQSALNQYGRIDANAAADRGSFVYCRWEVEVGIKTTAEEGDEQQAYSRPDHGNVVPRSDVAETNADADGQGVNDHDREVFDNKSNSGRVHYADDIFSGELLFCNVQTDLQRYSDQREHCYIH